MYLELQSSVIDLTGHHAQEAARYSQADFGGRWFLLVATVLFKFFCLTYLCINCSEYQLRNCPFPHFSLLHALFCNCSPIVIPLLVCLFNIRHELNREESNQKLICACEYGTTIIKDCEFDNREEGLQKVDDIFHEKKENIGGWYSVKTWGDNESVCMMVDIRSGRVMTYRGVYEKGTAKIR